MDSIQERIKYDRELIAEFNMLLHPSESMVDAVCAASNELSQLTEGSYTDYLEDWEERYGDSKTGEFLYYQYGREKYAILKRMTTVEFDHALFQVKVIMAEIKGLQELPERAKSSEYDFKVQELFNKSFDFELALFM